MIEQRAVEIRLSQDPDRQGPGILNGVLMTYDQRASDRAERFELGSLHWPDDGVVLREQHNRQAPIARFTPELDGPELRVAIPLPDTARGRDAATNIRAGVLTGLSVEFRAEREGTENGVRVIRRAKLVGAGLVDDPSYTGSTVEVREQRDSRRRVWL